MRMRTVRKQVFLVGGTVLAAAILLIPVFWMVIAALRPNKEILGYPPTLISNNYSTKTFAGILSEPTYFAYFRNSTVVSISTLLVAMVLGSLGAYGLSRFKLKGARGILVAMLALLMVPRVTIIIPYFKLAHFAGIYDTNLALVIVNAAFDLPVSVWLLKGYLDAIPVALEEAAMIDGANRMQVLWHIVLPLCVPGLVGVGTMAAIDAWNEFLFAVVLTSSTASQTLPIGLSRFFGAFFRDWNSIMALATLSSLPLFLIFVFFQRWVVQGMTSGSVK